MNVVTMQYIRATEFLRSLRENEDGQGLVEYALIIAVVSVGLIAALGFLKGDIEAVFDEIGNTLNP